MLEKCVNVDTVKIVDNSMANCNDQYRSIIQWTG